MSRKPNKRVNMGPARELKDFVERIVALEVERASVKRDWKEEDDGFKAGIVEVYGEAGTKGYDEDALKLAVKRRHESTQARARRQEIEALADVYQAAIGDLGGKPLDDLTRRRIDEQMRQHQGEGEKQDDGQSELPTDMQPEPEETSEQAHEKGKQARKDAKRIVDNPYHSSSPLRAAWDEGWCEEDGSDGMEIPAAWRKREEKKEAPASEASGEKAEGEGEHGEQQQPPPPPGGDGQNAGAQQ